MIDDLWYKNAIIYCLDVGTFMDANGDGVGDFEGLVAAAGLPGRAGRHVRCGCCRSTHAQPRQRLRHHATTTASIRGYGSLGRLRRVLRSRRASAASASSSIW